MIRRMTGAMALCGLLLATAPTRAQEGGRVIEPDESRIAGGEFNILATRLRGRFEREQFGGIGQTIHYGRHLEYDKYDAAYEAEAWVWLSRLWRVEARWLGASYTDHGDVRRAFLHDGEVFTPGERVKSRIDINVISGGARVTFGGGDDLRLSIPFGIVYTNHYLRIESRDVDARGSSRIQTWTPYVGFGIQSQFNDVVGFSAEARMFAYRTDNIQRHAYFELDANLTFSFLDGRLRAHTGPRIFAQDYHSEHSNENDRTSDFTITGWQFGAALDF